MTRIRKSRLGIAKFGVETFLRHASTAGNPDVRGDNARQNYFQKF